MRGLAVVMAAALALAAAGARAEDLPIDKLSIEETFAFLAGGVNDQGVLSFEAHTDENGERVLTQRITVENAHAHGDTKRCTFTTHRHVTEDGAVTEDQDIAIPLRHARAVRIAPWSAVALRGKPLPRGQTLTTTPQIWVLEIDRDDGGAAWLDFADHAGADQAADAVRHIKYLCDAHR
jgi:hypothetical protein